MLSRVANRVYWLARYMERAENTAKLANVYTNLLLDLPGGTDVGWHNLIRINSAEDIYARRAVDMTESNVMQFLLSDEDYSGSLYSSLLAARENARTARDILPSETWELINGLQLQARAQCHLLGQRTYRVAFLAEVIRSGQRLEGILTSGLSRDDTHSFLHLGRLIERADNTTRILDMGSLLLTEESIQRMRGLGGVVWMNLLKTMNAYQMYRQHVRKQLGGPMVIQFLMLDDKFPRAVLYCLDSLAGFAGKLPGNRDVCHTIDRVRDQLCSIQLAGAQQEDIHAIMDQMQALIYQIDASIAQTWFNIEYDA